jgi:Fur family zinc uptake transcriptional regulator
MVEKVVAVRVTSHGADRASRSAPPTDAFLRRAEAVCLRAGEQFTPLRRGVLAVFRTLNRPMGAYDLAPICSEQLRRQIYPSSVYRVLQFWCELGLVVHLSGHNTFVLSENPEGAHLVFVCTQCGSAIQHDDHAANAALRRVARALNFIPCATPVEIAGTCVRCKSI